MALSANLTRTSTTADGVTSTWTDQTVYGSPNADRNTVAIYLTAYKVDIDQVETAITVGVFDPELATTFTTTNGVDGWYKYYFSIIPYWSNAGGAPIYNHYDLVWDSAGNAYYEYINLTPSGGGAANPIVSNTAYWSVVSNPNIKIANVGASTASGNLVYQVVDKVLTFQTSICYIKAAAKHAKETCGSDDCGCDSRLGKLFHKIRDLFNNMPLNESTGQYKEGEKNARLAERWCDDCGCLTR